MPTEYVVVEDPHGPPDSHGLDPADRPSWRRRLAALIAIAGVAVGAFWLLEDDGGESSPQPTATPAPADAARATALAYAEYLDRRDLVACMAERGYPYEAVIVDNAASLAMIADYLAVTPATEHPEAPLPLLRHPDLYLGRGGQAVEVATGSVGCALTRTGVDVSDDNAVRGSVDNARRDPGFLAVLAEQVWVQQHPAEVSQSVALLRLNGGEYPAGDGDAQGRWRHALDVATSVVDAGADWIPVTVATTDRFAQAAGLTASGQAVVIRVGERDEPLTMGLTLTRAEAIMCGPVAISGAIKTPYGSQEELMELMAALAPGCNALVGAGYVEAETMADVYFD